MKYTGHKPFGWRKDKLDARDHKFQVERTTPLATVNLGKTHNLGVVFDQGQLGSCTANGLAFAAYYDLLNKDLANDTLKAFIPSRLFIYYFERVLENTVNSDAGAEIRDGIKVINSYGLPPETEWPYEISQFTTAPPEAVVAAGKQLTTLTYKSIDNTNKGLIVSALDAGLPVVFGISVYSSFMTETVAKTGNVPMPNVNAEQLEGGHCMAIVAYNATKDTFQVRNSWGSGWGQKGYCTMPASYLTDPTLATDFWVVYSLKENA